MYVPGLLIWDLLFRNEKKTYLEAIPYHFALSLGWLALVIVGVSFLAAPKLDVFVTVLYATISVLLLLVFFLPRHFSHISRFFLKPENPWLLVALVALTSITMIFLYLNGGERGVDSWNFLRTSQQVIRDNALNLRDLSRGFGASYAFPLTLILVGVIAHISSTDVVTVWFYLPIFFAVMSVLAIYTFSGSLFNSNVVAFVSTVVFIVSQYYHQTFSVFAQLTTPDILNVNIFLPLFLAIAVRWLYNEKWDFAWMLLLLSVTAVMAIVHNSKYFYAILLLVSISFLHTIFWRRDWQYVFKLLSICVVMTLMFVVGFEVAKVALGSSNSNSFISIIADRNEREFQYLYSDFYPFPTDGTNGVFHIWVFPVSLLLFPFARKPTERLAATFIFTGLFLGAVVYLQPWLWSLAMTIIPKLNRFFSQLLFLFVPLTWGWLLSMSSSIIWNVASRRMSSSKKSFYTWLVIFLVILGFVLTVGFLAYRWPREHLTGLILRIYPVHHLYFFIAAFILAGASMFLRSRPSQFGNWINLRVLVPKNNQQPAWIAIIFIGLFLLITPDHPNLALAQVKTPDPNRIILEEFDEPVREWWEPKLLSVFDKKVPLQSRILTQCWPRYYLNPLVKQELVYDKSLFLAFDPRLDLTSYVEALTQAKIDYILFTNGPSSWYSDCSDEEDIMIKNFEFLKPILTQFPELFEIVYSSSKNALFKISSPESNRQMAETYWHNYQAALEQEQNTEAIKALQLWAVYNSDPQAKCTVRSQVGSLATKHNDPLNLQHTSIGEDIATLRAGATIINFAGFSNRPDRPVSTTINGNRFDGYAATYAESDGGIPCNGAWIEIDLGQERNLRFVEIEFVENTVRDGQLDYWTGQEWRPAFHIKNENHLLKQDFSDSIRTSKVRLFLNSANKKGLIGVRRISLYEQQPFVPSGQDVALQSAGTTVEAYSPVLMPALSVESAIDGSEFDGDGVVAGGPDENYPHWFVLDFNQMRTINAIEIQWYHLSYGQYWEINYYDGRNWQELRRETDWQPSPNYLYQYVLPHSVEGSKIRLQVNWTSGGRMAIRRFSVFGG
jgi:hypothetical protein